MICIAGMSGHKHQTSGLQQESTDIATDEHTARVYNRHQFETPDERLVKATSREVILPTQTAPEPSVDKDATIMHDIQ